jgi:hypothetical protein
MATNTRTHILPTKSARPLAPVIFMFTYGKAIASRYIHAHLGGSICDSVNFGRASVECTYEHIYNNAKFP